VARSFSVIPMPWPTHSSNPVGPPNVLALCMTCGNPALRLYCRVQNWPRPSRQKKTRSAHPCFNCFAAIDDATTSFQALIESALNGVWQIRPFASRKQPDKSQITQIRAWRRPRCRSEVCCLSYLCKHVLAPGFENICKLRYLATENYLVLSPVFLPKPKTLTMRSPILIIRSKTEEGTFNI